MTALLGLGFDIVLISGEVIPVLTLVLLEDEGRCFGVSKGVCSSSDAAFTSSSSSSSSSSFPSTNGLIRDFLIHWVPKSVLLTWTLQGSHWVVRWNNRSPASNDRSTASNDRSTASNGRSTSSNGRSTAWNNRSTAGNNRSTCLAVDRHYLLFELIFFGILHIQKLKVKVLQTNKGTISDCVVFVLPTSVLCILLLFIVT